MSIFDVGGRKVYTQTKVPGNTDIVISHPFEPGIYYLNISSEEKKRIVERILKF
jgi:hypothetical protein